MRNPIQFVGFLFVAMLAGCTSSQTDQPLAVLDAPIIVIRQYPDYPSDNGAEFEGGLVAALWRDGRIIRPDHHDAIGKSYVEGVVSRPQSDAFFAFLDSSTAVRLTKDGGIP